MGGVFMPAIVFHDHLRRQGFKSRMSQEVSRQISLERIWDLVGLGEFTCQEFDEYFQYDHEGDRRLPRLNVLLRWQVVDYLGHSRYCLTERSVRQMREND